MSDDIIIHIKVHLAALSVELFLAAFKKAFDAACAEPNCTFLEVYRDPENPGEISWVEHWNASKEWLMENVVTKEEYKDYYAATKELSLKPQEVVILQRMDGA
ncbi:hypothetical protein ACKAV7_008391 [Fusarium commune]